MSRASVFFAAIHMTQKPMYWTPDGPGHWPEGSAELPGNGLPKKPKLVDLIHTLPAVETQAPGPLMSGGAWMVAGDRARSAAARTGSAVGSGPGAGAPWAGGTKSSSTRAENTMRMP